MTTPRAIATLEVSWRRAREPALRGRIECACFMASLTHLRGIVVAILT